mmetsp:Transcript_1345/g.1729  ORF Transcript_1345/g.1729 Transcript_1345/m.1729 type:complete len:520 (-) Transcript_1345:79-1638(-)
MAFLQTCIIPRALFSAEDALYCAQFGKLLHTQRVPGFSTAFFLMKAADIVSNIFCTTEREANNLSVYIDAVLSYTSKWYNDRNAYAKECLGRFGFTKDARGKGNVESIKYDDFKKMVNKSFDNMTKVIMVALKSNDYMKIRNGLTVCSKIIESYPRTAQCVSSLKEVVSILSKDDRQDIKIMSKRYLAMLDKQIRDGKLEGAVPKAKPSQKTEKPVATSTSVPAKRKAPATITTTTNSKIARTTSSSAAKTDRKTDLKMNKTEAVKKEPVTSTLEDESDGEIRESDNKEKEDSKKATSTTRGRTDSMASKKRSRSSMDRVSDGTPSKRPTASSSRLKPEPSGSKKPSVVSSLVKKPEETSLPTVKNSSTSTSSSKPLTSSAANKNSTSAVASKPSSSSASKSISTAKQAPSEKSSSSTSGKKEPVTKPLKKIPFAKKDDGAKKTMDEKSRDKSSERNDRNASRGRDRDRDRDRGSNRSGKSGDRKEQNTDNSRGRDSRGRSGGGNRYSSNKNRLNDRRR